MSLTPEQKSKRNKRIAIGTAGAVAVAGAVVGIILGVKSCDDSKDNTSNQAQQANANQSRNLVISDGMISSSVVSDISAEAVQLENVEVAAGDAIVKAEVKTGNIISGTLATGDITEATYASSEGFKQHVAGTVTDAELSSGTLSGNIEKGFIKSYVSKSQNADGTWNFEGAIVEGTSSQAASIEHVKSYTGLITSASILTQQAPQGQPLTDIQGPQDIQGGQLTNTDVKDVTATDVTFVGKIDNNGQVHGVISSGDITSGSVTSGDLQTGTVTGSHGTKNKTGGQVTSGDITSGVVRGSAVEGGVITGGVTQQLPDGSVVITGADLSKATLTDATITNSVVEDATLVNPVAVDTSNLPADIKADDTDQKEVEAFALTLKDQATTLTSKLASEYSLSSSSWTDLGITAPVTKDGVSISLAVSEIKDGSLVISATVSKGMASAQQTFNVTGFKTQAAKDAEDKAAALAKAKADFGNAFTTSKSDVMPSELNFAVSTVVTPAQLGINVPNVNPMPTLTVKSLDDATGEMIVTVTFADGTTSEATVSGFMTTVQKANVAKAQADAAARKKNEADVQAGLDSLTDQVTSNKTDFASHFVAGQTYTAAELGIDDSHLTAGSQALFTVLSTDKLDVKVQVEVYTGDLKNPLPTDASNHKDIIVSGFRNPDEKAVSDLLNSFTDQVTTRTDVESSVLSAGPTTPTDLGITPFASQNGATISYEVVSTADGKANVKVTATINGTTSSKVIQVTGFKTAAQVKIDADTKVVKDALASIASTYTTSLTTQSPSFTDAQVVTKQELGISFPVPAGVTSTIAVKHADADKGEVTATVTLTKDGQTLTQDITVSGFKTTADVQKDADTKAVNDALALFRDQVTSKPTLVATAASLDKTVSDALTSIGAATPSGLSAFTPDYVIKTNSANDDRGELVITVTLTKGTGTQAVTKSTDFKVTGFTTNAMKANATAAKAIQDVLGTISDQVTSRTGSYSNVVATDGSIVTENALGINAIVTQGTTIELKQIRATVGEILVEAKVTSNGISQTKQFRVTGFKTTQDVTVYEYNGVQYATRADALAVATPAEEAKIQAVTEYTLKTNTYATQQAAEAAQKAAADALVAAQAWASGNKPADGSIAPAASSVVTVFVFDGKAYDSAANAQVAWRAKNIDTPAHDGSFAIHYGSSEVTQITIDAAHKAVYASEVSTLPEVIKGFSWVKVGTLGTAHVDAHPAAVVTLPASPAEGDTITVDGVVYTYANAVGNPSTATKFTAAQIETWLRAHPDQSVIVAGKTYTYTNRAESVTSQTLQQVRDANNLTPFTIDGTTYTEVHDLPATAHFAIVQPDGTILKDADTPTELFEEVLKESKRPDGSQRDALAIKNAPMATGNTWNPTLKTYENAREDKTNYPMLTTSDVMKKIAEAQARVLNQYIGGSTSTLSIDEILAVHEVPNINVPGAMLNAFAEIDKIPTANVMDHLHNLDDSDAWVNFFNVIKPLYCDYLETRGFDATPLRNYTQVETYEDLKTHTDLITLLKDSGLDASSASMFPGGTLASNLDKYSLFVKKPIDTISLTSNAKFNKVTLNLFENLYQYNEISKYETPVVLNPTLFNLYTNGSLSINSRSKLINSFTFGASPLQPTIYDGRVLSQYNGVNQGNTGSNPGAGSFGDANLGTMLTNFKVGSIAFKLGEPMILALTNDWSKALNADGSYRPYFGFIEGPDPSKNADGSLRPRLNSLQNGFIVKHDSNNGQDDQSFKDKAIGLLSTEYTETYFQLLNPAGHESEARNRIAMFWPGTLYGGAVGLYKGSVTKETDLVIMKDGINTYLTVKDYNNRNMFASTFRPGDKAEQDRLQAAILAALPQTLYKISADPKDHAYSSHKEDAFDYVKPFTGIYEGASLDAKSPAIATIPDVPLYKLQGKEEYVGSFDPAVDQTSILEGGTAPSNGHPGGWFRQAPSTLTDASRPTDLTVKPLFSVSAGVYTTDQTQAHDYVAEVLESRKDQYKLVYTKPDGTQLDVAGQTQEVAFVNGASGPKPTVDTSLVSLSGFTAFTEPTTFTWDPALAVAHAITNAGSYTNLASGADITTTPLVEQVGGFSGFIADGKFYETRDAAIADIVRSHPELAITSATALRSYNQVTYATEAEARAAAAAQAATQVHETHTTSTITVNPTPQSVSSNPSYITDVVNIYA